MVAGNAGTSRPEIPWAKLASPLAYALAFMPILVLNFAALYGVNILVTLVWPEWYIKSGYNPGEIALIAGAFLTTLLVFGVLFGGLGRLLLRWERVSMPGLIDHLRRCALLYGALLLLGSMFFWAVEFPPSSDVGFGYGVALLTFLCIAYSIVLDAALVFLERRRYARTDLGGST